PSAARTAPTAILRRRAVSWRSPWRAPRARPSLSRQRPFARASLGGGGSSRRSRAEPKSRHAPAGPVRRNRARQALPARVGCRSPFSPPVRVGAGHLAAAERAPTILGTRQDLRGIGLIDRPRGGGIEHREARQPAVELEVRLLQTRVLDRDEVSG